jgi:hypothetical protein
VQRLCHTADARSHRSSLRSKVITVSNVSDIAAEFFRVEKIVLKNSWGFQPENLPTRGANQLNVNEERAVRNERKTKLAHG